jgi:enamine deaminase RidA (YjgF/YER057c/UK114 family)
LNRVQLSGRQSGYNDAASGAGIIAISGQTAEASVIDARGGFPAEFDSALANVIRVLGQAGAVASDLLLLRIFVTNMETYLSTPHELADSYRRHLSKHYPAMTLVEVGSLVGGALVEIEGLAVAPNPAGTSGA